MRSPDKNAQQINLNWLAKTALVFVIVGFGNNVSSEPTYRSDEPLIGGHEINAGRAKPSPIGQLDQLAEYPEHELIAAYDRIRRILRDGYAKSGMPEAASYQSWRRFNRIPYISPVKGGGYRNNYANSVGESYGDPMRAGIFPIGSILAKDSFEVDERGQIIPGPLALMEKMPSGFNEGSRDWQFSLIEADGTVLGKTNGQNDEKVLFCLGCHVLAKAERDYVFFVPKQYR